MTWRRVLPEYDLDVIEVGERAAFWLAQEALGPSHSVRVRAWAVTWGCYAKCVASLGRGSVPPQWKPAVLRQDKA